MSGSTFTKNQMGELVKTGEEKKADVFNLLNHQAGLARGVLVMDVINPASPDTFWCSPYVMRTERLAMESYGGDPFVQETASTVGRCLLP
jgi:hypothetical protein